MRIVRLGPDGRTETSDFVRHHLRSVLSLSVQHSDPDETQQDLRIQVRRV